MRREKRTERLQAHVTPSMREQLELFVQEAGNVVSMSDYLYEVLEEHVAMKSVHITKRQLTRRIGN